jgi:hypothetical protein
MTSNLNRRQEPARDLDLRYAPFLMCSSRRQTLRYCDTVRREARTSTGIA